MKAQQKRGSRRILRHRTVCSGADLSERRAVFVVCCAGVNTDREAGRQVGRYCRKTHTLTRSLSDTFAKLTPIRLITVALFDK